MASMASEHCFFCKAEIAEFITGWPLKDGSFAKLCGKCGYAYIHDKFCETFHSKSDGWRHCDGCKKRLHCGCIMSCHTYTELDYGGVGCSKCLLRSKKSMESAANEGTYLTTLSDSDTHSVVSNEIIAECCSPGSSKGKTSAHIGENSNVDSSGHTGCEEGVESETPQVDASTQNHLSNIDAIPLFEKSLTASDTFLNTARLVIPKKCAEAHFPKISETQGFPIAIQDYTGRDWKFQYRCWQNSNSKKMYVLEGLKDYMMLNQWQVGDTVTFHRTEQEGKLIIGTKKTPASVASIQALKEKIWKLLG
ncbi:B3 domain-containing transcription factor VAL3-like [Prunus yedoensis var. nudiflora]|uniref:B3 domain-containing transcription factor VAL3-like n=1 Tax=Prunus yedoensis var. nudiflora TaxID=2094558 RepID=A0A314YWC5_PRUYE|nr:B3 domain-containing transcription factor VAL3-like [Prunus yedoensis var. nudiflora]